MTFNLDRRTRRRRDICPVSVDELFVDRFPAMTERYGHLVAEAMRVLDAPPLTIEVDEVAWTLRSRGGTVAAEPRHGDGLTITFDADQLSDWAHDVRSLNGFAVAMQLRHRGGQARDVSVWDSLWRCLLDGWPVVGDIDFVDRHGAPLDLARLYTPDDDPEDVAHALREAGFLHLRGWLEPQQVAALSSEIDQALPRYTPDDGRSWWARLQDDSHRCVRMQEFAAHSPTATQLVDSDRWEHLRATLAADDDLIQARPGDAVFEALVKPVGVVAGVSDLSFHRDCHLGGHGLGCAGVDVGITVTDSGPHNGSLEVVSGSHRLAIPVDVAETTPYLPVVPVATEAGDLTVHLSCTLHASTAPKVATRKVMYAPFKLAPLPDDAASPPDNAELRNQVYKRLLEGETLTP